MNYADITYSDIEKVNGEITMLPIEKMDKKTGKVTRIDYAMVPDRVTAFRKVFTTGFITTDIVSHDGNTVLMKCTAGYYENGVPIILATGYAQEVKGLGLVNGTSYIENCETSAVGRALGMMGFGLNGGGICSAEELANAITAQNQMKENDKHINDGFKSTDQIEKAKTLPVNPVANFIRNEIVDIQKIVGIAIYDDAKKQVVAMGDTLAKSGAVPPFDWKTLTMDEAKNLFKAIREILPEGDEK